MQIWHNTPVATVLKNFARVHTEARGLVGGGTNLYDSAGTALSSMRKTESGVVRDDKGNTVLRFMVVFTDGEDTGSAVTLQGMVQDVADPGFENFQFVGLVAGANSEAMKMQSAFLQVRHAHVLSATDCSNNSIHAVFGKADKQMREARRVLVEELRIVLVNNNRNAQPQLGKMVNQYSNPLIKPSNQPGMQNRTSTSGHGPLDFLQLMLQNGKGFQQQSNPPSRAQSVDRGRSRHRGHSNNPTSNR